MAASSVEHFTMPPEHIDALQGVGVTVVAGSHGEPISLDDHVNAMLFVNTSEYTATRAVVDTLQPERGDTICIERPDGVSGAWSPRNSLHILHEIVRQSPYLDLQASTPQSEIIEEASKLWVIGPLDYVEMRAATTNLPCVYTDVTPLEEEKWIHDQRYARLSESELHTGLTRYSNSRMLHGIGETALRMPKHDDDPAQLVFFGGLRHGRALQKVLAANDIPVTAVRAGSLASIAEAWLGQLGESTEAVVRTVVGKPFGSDSWPIITKYFIHKWRANARAYRAAHSS